MSLITWSDALSVGVEELDNQHKALFSIINELHSQMVLGRGNEAIRPTLARLIGYTKSHFAIEEALFETHGYPERQLHRQQHDELTASVLALQSDLADGNARVTVATMQFLRDWLSDHILHEDMQYKQFFARKGVK